MNTESPTPKLKELRVSTSSNIHSLAGALVQCFRNNEATEVSVVGSRALAIAMKALCTANRTLLGDAVTLYASPRMFDRKEADGSTLTVTGLRILPVRHA